jgi:hypothetical protein
MRSPLGKECRKLFRKMMAVQFPEYREDRAQAVPQGWYVWTHQHPAKLFFHINLVIHSTRDAFTTEVGWSFDGKLPYSLTDVSEVFSAPALVRLGEIWSGQEYWWPLVLRPEEFENAILYWDDPIEECLPLAPPAVWEAGEKLRDHFVPIVKQVVQKHGNGTPHGVES